MASITRSSSGSGSDGCDGDYRPVITTPTHLEDYRNAQIALMNLSRYFTLDELTHSNTAKAERIDNQPGLGEIMHLQALCAAVLDPLREAVGRPIRVNSGYRGPALNHRIRGAKNSQHLTGQAADIQSPGTAVLELFKKVIRLQLPFDQLIYEVNGSAKWVHLSHKPGANRGEILLARFAADGRVSYPRITAQQALEMTEPATRGMRSGAEPGYIEMADEPEQKAPRKRASHKAATKKSVAKAKKKTAGGKRATAKRAGVKKTSSKSAKTKKVVVRGPKTKKATGAAPVKAVTRRARS